MTSTPQLKQIKLQILAVPVIVIAAGTAFLYFAAPIVVPIVVSVALSYILMPFVDLIKKLRVPHWAAVTIVMLVITGLFTVALILLIAQMRSLSTDLPGYIDKIMVSIQTWAANLSRYFSRVHGFPKEGAGVALNADRLQSLAGYILKWASSLTGLIINIVAVFFLVLFMLLESNDLTEKVSQISKMAGTQELNKTINEINLQLRGFIQVRFYDFVGLSIVLTGGLMLLDVPYSYIWGPLNGFLNIIPHIGPIIGAIPAIIVAGIYHNSFIYMIYVAIFFIVIDEIEGHLIWPKLTSATIDLSGLTVLIALVYWGWLWGVIGLLLAVPITSASKVMCDHIEPLKPVGVLMGQRRNKRKAQSPKDNSK